MAVGRRTDFSTGSCCAGALADPDVGGDGVQVGSAGCDAHDEDYAVVLTFKCALRKLDVD